jgi:rRNA maturation RNase YbeY
MKENLETGYCQFANHGVRIRLGQKTRLSAYVRAIIQHYTGKQTHLQYTFVSDEFLYEMNVQYLQHDSYTDIITFDLGEQKSPWIIGDIYISIDRVKENARLAKLTFQHELHRVIFHGALHLCGFGDKTPAQAKKMRALEDEWLLKYFEG